MDYNLTLNYYLYNRCADICSEAVNNVILLITFFRSYITIICFTNRFLWALLLFAMYKQ